MGFARDECEFDGRTRVDGSVPSFQMQVLCTLVNYRGLPFIHGWMMDGRPEAWSVQPDPFDGTEPNGVSRKIDGGHRPHAVCGSNTRQRPLRAGRGLAHSATATKARLQQVATGMPLGAVELPT